MHNTPEASRRARKRWKQLRVYVRTLSMFQRSRQYRCEGDPLWNTPEKRKIREAARHDPRVVAIIDRFWKILDMLKDEHGACGVPCNAWAFGRHIAAVTQR